MPIDRQRDILAFRGLVSGNITELTDNEVQVETKIASTVNFLSGLSELERIDASKISISSSASSTFHGCIALRYARLSNVENIPSKTFYACRYLQEVSLPSALRIGYQAFSNCKTLSSVSLPAAHTIEKEAFMSSSSLVNITLPSVIDIKNSAFSYCVHLETIDLGESAATIGESALDNTNLLHLAIRNTSAVCTYTNSFASADPKNSQLKIYVPRALLDSYKTATNWSRLASKFVALEDYTVDGTTTGELVT